MEQGKKTNYTVFKRETLIANFLLALAWIFMRKTCDVRQHWFVCLFVFFFFPIMIWYACLKIVFTQGWYEYIPYNCLLLISQFIFVLQNENHNFNGGGLLWIALEWTLAPLLACAMAFCLFVVLKTSLLRHENAEKRILIFLPIYHGIAAGLLCLFIMYQVLKPHHLYIFNNTIDVGQP